MKRSSTLITSVNFEDAQDIRSPNNNKLPFYDVVYNERRIQSNKLKYITKDELIIKLVFCEGLFHFTLKETTMNNIDNQQKDDFYKSFFQTYYIFPEIKPQVVLKMLLDL